MSFGDDLARFEKRASDVVQLIFRESVFDLFASITMGTPVDKGVLRNNWVAKVNAYSSQVRNRNRRGGDDSLTSAANITKVLKFGQFVTFTNNLPYATPIEYDAHSGQAPSGMVRVNAARWEQIVKNNARKYGI